MPTRSCAESTGRARWRWPFARSRGPGSGTWPASEMPDALRARFLTALDRHGRFLELNLSVYFSPNTHLLGEAVALHALGVLFPAFPRAARWAETGGRIVEQQMERQVRDDGSHFEQSAYYHVTHWISSCCTVCWRNRRRRTTRGWLRWPSTSMRCWASPASLPLIGDDDGGRLFHPYGERAGFGRATMATCAVLLQPARVAARSRSICTSRRHGGWARMRCRHGARRAPAPRVSRFFSDGGMAVMAAGDVQLVVKAGPFGEGSGGHSHSDVLSLTARAGGREILIDPGTFTYVADPAERNRFRGSARAQHGPHRWPRPGHSRRSVPLER